MFVHVCSAALYIHMWVPDCLCVGVTMYMVHMCVHMCICIEYACVNEWVPVCIQGKCLLILNPSTIYPVSP